LVTLSKDEQLILIHHKDIFHELFVDGHRTGFYLDFLLKENDINTFQLVVSDVMKETPTNSYSEFYTIYKGLTATAKEQLIIDRITQLKDNPTGPVLSDPLKQYWTIVKFSSSKEQTALLKDKSEVLNQLMSTGKLSVAYFD